MSMIRLRQQEELFQSLQTIFRKEESNRSNQHTKPKRTRSNLIVHRLLQTKATAYTHFHIQRDKWRTRTIFEII
jgi:hypothetical protein